MSLGRGQGSGLSVIALESGHRFVIDAGSVERLEPMTAASGDAAGDDVPVVRLGRRLALACPSPPGVLISFLEHEGRLAVEAVESVVDLAAHRLISLPVLTRLSSPVFRGVHEVEGDLLPALDIEVVLNEEAW